MFCCSRISLGDLSNFISDFALKNHRYHCVHQIECTMARPRKWNPDTQSIATSSGNQTIS